MKKIYFAPNLNAHNVETCAMLCGSAKGGVDEKSISNERAEDMVKRNTQSSNSVQWDNWE